jgi:hypothetical protein
MHLQESLKTTFKNKINRIYLSTQIISLNMIFQEVFQTKAILLNLVNPVI